MYRSCRSIDQSSDAFISNQIKFVAVHDIPSISTDRKQPKTASQRNKEYRERKKLRQAERSAITGSSNVPRRRRYGELIMAMSRSTNESSDAFSTYNRIRVVPSVHEVPSISRNKKEPKTSTQRSKEYRKRIKLRQADASATTISSNAKTERNKCKRKNQASGEGSSPTDNVEINKNTRVGYLPTAEVNLKDNTDGQTDNVIKVKTEADDTDVHLRSREGTSEDNSNELGHDILDYVNEVKTEVDEIDIKEEEVKETRYDGADYVSEVKTEVDEIDIKEEELIETRHDRADYVSEVKIELGNPSAINSVHARKRRRLDIEDSSMDFTDAVNAMKSPLQEDEDSAFFNSLLPSVRSLNTDQKFKFRLKTVQLLQDIRNFFS